MNFVDIILGIILLYAIFKGLRNGFFVELASLFSLLLGIYLSIKFSDFTADFIRKNLSFDSEYLEIIAFLVTFVLVVIAVTLLAKVFTKIVDFASLGWINRLFGAVFGLLKMIFILSISIHFFQKINTNNAFISEEKTNQSILYNPIIEVSKFVFPIISDWFDIFKEENTENHIENQPSLDEIP